MPLAFANAASAGTNPSPGTMNPPSPWIGSRTMAAIWSAPSCFSIRWIAWSAQDGPQSPYVAPVGQRYGYDIGIRYTSGAAGPSPLRYGIAFAVMVMASDVRPWNAWSNTTM